MIIYVKFMYLLTSFNKRRHKNNKNNKESVIYSYKRHVGICFIFHIFVGGRFPSNVYHRKTYKQTNFD